MRRSILERGNVNMNMEEVAKVFSIRSKKNKNKNGLDEWPI